MFKAVKPLLWLRGFLFEGSTKSSEGGPEIRDGMEVERVSPAARRGVFPMAKSVQKISLSASRDIPFDRLVLRKPMSGV